MYTYLALGDSYTIGECVPIYESFPYQTVQQLRSRGFEFCAAEIIARTGWTTEDLLDSIEKTMLLSRYSIVSLLIGVNDQYREGSIDEYSKNLRKLLEKAIRYSGNNPSKVFTLSIPDWGVTPFATGRNRQIIASEIDSFNKENSRIAAQNGVLYKDITGSSREAANDLSLLCHDHLHPSGKEYSRWADQLATEIEKQIKS